jgi:2-methylisocitrate lyase-like PEP mutase family enzyme
MSRASRCSRPSSNGMAERLRRMLEEPGPIALPGCYDVLSAMLLEHAKFPAVFLSGYGVAASLLGNPDIGLTTLLETSLMTRAVASRIGIPVVVDADNGYGNEDNTVRVVNELEHGGAAAMILEDQVMPKRCGHTGNKEIVPLPVYMRKLEAALKARTTPLVVVARTDALCLDEGIARANTFLKAGADVALIDGLKSLDALKRVGQEVNGPKQVNLIYGGATPPLSVEELAALGFKVILYSTPALFLAARALMEHLPRLREARDLKSISSASCTFTEFQGFVQARYTRDTDPPSSRPSQRLRAAHEARLSEENAYVDAE